MSTFNRCASWFVSGDDKQPVFSSSGVHWESKRKRSPQWSCMLATGALLFAAGLDHAYGQAVFSDPVGDTVGSGLTRHDILYLNSHRTPTEISLEVGIGEAISPPSSLGPRSIVGYVDLDVDQSATTGVVSHQSQYLPPTPSQLGVEFYVDLFSEEFSPGFAELIDTTTSLSIAQIPVSFAEKSFSLTIPLALLNDDGILSYGVILGDFVDFSDDATAYSVPEPGSMSTGFVGFALLLVSVLRKHQHAPKSSKSPS